MQMTNEEILRSFKNAEDRRGQVTRLAELNACDEQKIKDILMAQGVDGRSLSRKRGTAAQGVDGRNSPKKRGTAAQEAEKRHDSPSIVQAVAREMCGLRARLREIAELTEQLREEQTRIGVKLEALEAALPLLETAYMEQLKDMGTEG